MCKQRGDEWVEGMKGGAPEALKGVYRVGEIQEALQRRRGFYQFLRRLFCWRTGRAFESSACAESELQKGHKSVAWEMENFQHDWGVKAVSGARP